MSAEHSRIFISDLHLGDGSGADDFHQTDQFLRFLDVVEAGACQLIILGDLMELWQAALERVVFHHSRIIKRLLVLAREKRLIYIIGNHDHIPFVKYLDPQLNIQLEYKDERSGIWGEHGNQYDIFNRYQDPGLAVRNKLGRTISYIVGWAERIIHPDFDQWALSRLLKRDGLFLRQAAEVKNRITPSSREYYKRGGDLSEYEQAAKRIISNGYKIAIFGHTHQPALQSLGNGIYANCGCWCGMRAPTYIRVEEDRIELVRAIDHMAIISLVF